MVDWLPEWLRNLEVTWSTGLWIMVLTFTVFAVSSAVVTMTLVKLPAGYFLQQDRASASPARRPMLRWAVRIGKNLLGLVVGLFGIALSLPGVPGPGLLLVLIGVMLLDFPGKRRLEQKLIARPRVLKTVNWLRGRFGKAPLVLQDHPAGSTANIAWEARATRRGLDREQGARSV